MDTETIGLHLILSIKLRTFLAASFTAEQ